MWPSKTHNHSASKHSVDNSKYHPHPHLGFQMPWKMMYLMVGCLCFGVLLILLNLYQLHSLSAGMTVGDPEFGKTQRPILRSGYLNHVMAVFSRIGYVRTQANSRLFDVNHFPGSGYITNKVSLAVNYFPFIPPAFVVPKDSNKFLEEVRNYPNKLWVEKSNNHRGIRIKSLKGCEVEETKFGGVDINDNNEDEIDLTKGSNEYFVQEYIANPLLVDGRKFDIGVYTVLTSIDPLRVYVYDREVLIRFCEKAYYPFDPEDERKYVVGDTYTQPWELPSLKSLWTNGKYSRKLLLSTYLKQQGKNIEKMWNDIYTAIAEVYLRKEPDIINAGMSYRSTRTFFELVRFDFILDADMKVWLMEVNMSPNLSSAAHNENKLMYEQVIFNLLSLVGVATKLDHSLKYSSPAEKDMLVSDYDTQVLYEVCASRECSTDCHMEKCRLCFPCLREPERQFIKAAYLEHKHRGEFRRVYPPSLTHIGETRKDSPAFSLSSSNQLMAQWFKAMCQSDISWCV
ncbi:putative tubulin polyglutamylase ttll-15 [Acropora cervicornis]|uniref:Tubulin polyglutamylase ttll-15 n=1 Tax=Acropora cervicornis TaxID=6130 RepID=A0AAD9Q364_ACRCE|nr:putative tubulin polyglutamylase ttll-15 [Acropora cervicornis]